MPRKKVINGYARFKEYNCNDKDVEKTLHLNAMHNCFNWLIYEKFVQVEEPFTWKPRKSLR